MFESIKEKKQKEEMILRKDTVELRVDRYARRQKMSYWVGAGLAGIIVLSGLECVKGAPHPLQALLITLILISGWGLGFSRVQFEWAEVQLKRKKMRDGLQDKATLPTEMVDWPKDAEMNWNLCRWTGCASGLILLLNAWWGSLIACWGIITKWWVNLT